VVCFVQAPNPFARNIHSISRFYEVLMQPSIQTHHANCLCFNFGANMCKQKEALAYIDSKGASVWPRQGHFGGQSRSESFALARMNS
jgi:hypothetical protein